MPSGLFFHPEAERGERRRNREIFAKAICADCSVVDKCRSFALVAKEPYGIWGGLSEDERKEILKSKE